MSYQKGYGGERRASAAPPASPARCAASFPAAQSPPWSGERERGSVALQAGSTQKFLS